MPHWLSLSNDKQNLALIVEDTQMKSYLKIYTLDGFQIEDKGKIGCKDIELS
jgi:hypothetical protein